MEWNASVDHERQAYDETSFAKVAQEMANFDEKGLDMPLPVSGVEYTAYILRWSTSFSSHQGFLAVGTRTSRSLPQVLSDADVQCGDLTCL